MKKKKVMLGVCSSIIAIILIVFIVFVSIIFSKDFTSKADFDNREYLTGSPSELVVASYNVKSWDSSKENLVAIREQIAEHNVDIVGLQEVDTDNAIRSKKVQCTSTLASGEYKQYYFAPTKSLFLGEEYGIMTMSKHKIIDSCALYLPMPSRWFMIIGEPRVCTRTLININGTDIAFYNTHLSFENGVKMQDNKEMREAQIDFIYSTMEKDPCKYKVLTGDFNILDFSELDDFAKDGKYSMVNNKNSVFHSYRGSDVNFNCLDNIIYTNNFTLVEANMVNNNKSDHNMLYAKLKI